MKCPECAAEMMPGPSSTSVCDACENQNWRDIENLRANLLRTKLNYDRARITEKYLGCNHNDGAYGLKRAEQDYDDARLRYSRALIGRTQRLLPDKPKIDKTG